MTKVELAALLLAVGTLLVRVPFFTFLNKIKNYLRKLEGAPDNWVNYLFWTFLILFVVFAFLVIPEIGLLNFLVSGIIFTFFFRLIPLSQPDVFRSMIKTITRQSNHWLRTVNFILILLALFILYLLFW